MGLRCVLLFVLLVGQVALGGPGTPSDGAPAKIRDNLFLLEEAYNQEPGVIQHIQAYQLNPRTRAWSYTFTEEWPAPSDLHQLSLTLGLLSGTSGAPVLGDTLINYRLQAIGVGGTGAVALAPRLSLVLPTGDPRGSGRGVMGVQVNLPASIELLDSLVVHLNAGATFTPGVRAPGGRVDSALDTAVGAAFVWLPLGWANGVLEVAHLTAVDVGDDASQRSSTFVLNPGVRFAIDVGALQIVPGLSAPVQLSSRGIEFGALAYLSLEHPAWSP